MKELTIKELGEVCRELTDLGKGDLPVYVLMETGPEWFCASINKSPDINSGVDGLLLRRTTDGET